MQTGTRVEHKRRGDGWTGSVQCLHSASTVVVLWDRGSVTEVVSRYALRLVAGAIPGTVADNPSQRRMRRDRGAVDDFVALIMALVTAIVVIVVVASYFQSRENAKAAASASPVTRLLPDCSWATLLAHGGEYGQCVSVDETPDAWSVHDGVHVPIPLEAGDILDAHYRDDQGRPWFVVVAGYDGNPTGH